MTCRRTRPSIVAGVLTGVLTGLADTDELLTLTIAENNVSPAHNPGHLTEAA